MVDSNGDGRTVTARKRMTYQLALSGCDGVVIASDRSERTVSSNGQFAARNAVRKITIDQTGRYAWACSGSEAALIFSRNVRDRIAALGSSFAEEEALNALENASRTAVSEYQPLSQGPRPCKVLFVCGPSKRIFSHPLTRAEERIGKCISGMEFNLAAFLPSRLDLSNVPVQELAYLAAYSIHAAHDLDSAFVDGLDIAVYRNATGTFDFVDSAIMWDATASFDTGILELLRNKSMPLPFPEPNSSN
jgi:hypothetical protein